MTDRKEIGDRIVIEAAEWLGRLESDSTESDRRGFLNWVTRDSEHLRHVMELYALKVEAHRAAQSFGIQLEDTCPTRRTVALQSGKAALPLWIPSCRYAELRTAYGDNGELARFLRSLSGLTTECRRVLTLRKVYGWNADRIAEHLGVTWGVVENYMRECVISCARFYDRDAPKGGEFVEHGDTTRIGCPSDS